MILDLDDQGKAFLVRESCFLAQPEAVVDGEGVDCHGQMFRVDLGKFLATFFGEILDYCMVNMEIERER